MLTKFQSFLEMRAFGVCEWWGEKLGIKTSQIRLFYIYLSFLTFGSPIVIYLIMAFILKNKEWFKVRRTTIWEL
jgi:phage shock protein C